MQNPLLSRLGIEYPVIQAPMGGGPSTPELVAAVSNAADWARSGPRTWLLTNHRSDTQNQIAHPQAIQRESVCWRLLRQRRTIRRPMLACYPKSIRHSHCPPCPPGMPPIRSPHNWKRPGCRSADLQLHVRIPKPDAMAKLKARHITIIGTATTVEEARLLMEAGVDAILAQGAEAVRTVEHLRER